MPLVVEDGSNVAGANSYIDLVFLNAYATARGYELPTDDADKEQLVILATDYLEHFRDKYQGTKANTDQVLQWPRKDVTVDGLEVEEDAIPIELQNAQAQLVIEQNLGIKLYPVPASSSSTTTTPTGEITQQTIGPITVKYSSGSTSSSTSTRSSGSTVTPVIIASVQSFLKPLLKSSCSSLKTFRV